jgi:hypothetical protein
LVDVLAVLDILAHTITEDYSLLVDADVCSSKLKLVFQKSLNLDESIASILD